MWGKVRGGLPPSEKSIMVLISSPRFSNRSGVGTEYFTDEKGVGFGCGILV